jgi:hypothetical protein
MNTAPWWPRTGDLTTILCSALEMEQVKAPPGSAGCSTGLLAHAPPDPHHRDFASTTPLNVADPQVFTRDLSN